MERRFGLKIRFGPFRVLWKETVAKPAVGVGHYEPLRHYAEVWLRLEPGAPGSGIAFRSVAHVDDLTLNWQRLIRTHVFEREHHGVLTGSPLTDVTVVLLCGRAHLKHTEGGDFRQAVGRALRNALMGAENVLLEPLCGFEARFPPECFGTVMQAMPGLHAVTEPVERTEGQALLRGEAPYSLFQAWQDGFPALTRGRGTLRVWMSRYAPCHDQAEAVARTGYNPLADPEDTPESVFCAHGAGFNVAWDKVRDFAHLWPESPDGPETAL
jgi:translation elongation factor EF-G